MAIVADGIDGNSLRMSNAVTDGNFGNWLYLAAADHAGDGGRGRQRVHRRVRDQVDDRHVPAWSAALGLAAVGRRGLG